MTTPYVDPQSLHNPTVGGHPPASWGDAVRDGLEFLIAPPTVRAKRTSGSLSVVTSTWTPLTLNNADDWDTDAFHDPTTNSERITIPTGLGGRYRFDGLITYGGSSAGFRMIRLLVNGATDWRVFQGAPVPAGTATVVAFSHVLELAAGDYVQTDVWQSSGGNLGVTGYLTATWESR